MRLRPICFKFVLNSWEDNKDSNNLIYVLHTISRLISFIRSYKFRIKCREEIRTNEIVVAVSRRIPVCFFNKLIPIYLIFNAFDCTIRIVKYLRICRLSPLAHAAVESYDGLVCHGLFEVSRSSGPAPLPPPRNRAAGFNYAPIN